jgi:SpoVK/Ycf46/Vps4 family AAA+-type ATPase
MLFMTCIEFQGARLLSDAMWVNIELDAPDAVGSFSLWKEFISEYETEESVEVSQLAGKYKLQAGDIRYTLGGAYAIARSMGRKAITAEDISSAVKQHNGKSLGEYAELLDSRISRDELVVDEETAKQLEYIENRLKYRNLVDAEWGFDEKVRYGKGVCSLFYGPPGTGKTMAARVLATQLGLDIYRVDLSRMISKYIGETQKNITELFERAKGVNALLFFDEADAMFAKRTEVSDSHDRNSNSEVAHLLQKLEEYDGISILATNLKDNIDDAFKRRIKYMVYFAFPDGDTRAILWKKMLPDKAPVEEGLDLDFFAHKFEMSGSEIKDAVLHAAYMAAREQTAIGNSHIMEAVKLSFAKYGKVLKREDFGYIGI